MDIAVLILLLVLLIVVLVADIMAVALLVKAAKMKGHYTEGAGILWFIGLFGTMFMLGLVVASLPDRSGGVTPGAAADELPAI